jgi:hypothetical protein
MGHYGCERREHAERVGAEPCPSEKCTSLVSPLDQNGRHSTMGRATAVAGAWEMTPTSQPSYSRNGAARETSQISKREAGAAEQAPEALEVVGRHRAGPGVTLIVAVDPAGRGAAAHIIEPPTVHPFTARLAPGDVTTVARYRRPVRHRWRQRRVVARGEIIGA